NSSAIGLLAADTARAQDIRLGIEPVDVGAQAAPEEFAAAVRDALTSEGVDALVVVFVPPLAIPGTRYARALREVVDGAAERQYKPVVSTFLAAEGVPSELAVQDTYGSAGRGSIPSYPSPERAVNALSRVIRYAAWRERPKGSVVRPGGLYPDRAHEIVRDALDAAGTSEADDVVRGGTDDANGDGADEDVDDTV